MRKNQRSTELRNKAAVAFVASRKTDNATDRTNLRTKARGLKALAAAEEWLDDVRAAPASRSRAGKR